MFNVTYIDDFNRKHIFLAQDFETVKFFLKRFEKVIYQPLVG